VIKHQVASDQSGTGLDCVHDRMFGRKDNPWIGDLAFSVDHIRCHIVGSYRAFEGDRNFRPPKLYRPKLGTNIVYRMQSQIGPIINGDPVVDTATFSDFFAWKRLNGQMQYTQCIPETLPFGRTEKFPFPTRLTVIQFYGPLPRVCGKSAH
jgi:hypothetical protein